ncbi:MAG TPA: GDP-mannose 4,6-dehydratase, partial [Burkholderiales bacterium]
MHILITGAAGFIGSALAWRLLERGDRVTGLDNLNDYYDVALKQARLSRASARRGFEFVKADIVDAGAVRD